MVDRNKQYLGPLPLRIIPTGGVPGQSLLSHYGRLRIAADSLLQITRNDMRLGVGIPCFGPFAICTATVVITYSPFERLPSRKRIAQSHIRNPLQKRQAGPFITRQPLGIDRLQQSKGAVGMIRSKEAVNRHCLPCPVPTTNRNERRKQDCQLYNSSHAPDHKLICGSSCPYGIFGTNLRNSAR